ncbi:DUF4054 domain-containing protein [Listeria booriae]|uniref:DUF4054 domain-containing protein n=1 Tax=Listeria booriae TaxID=1552123 RepID=UPI001628DEF8|nr:DUF4054 domain-containing protein [Listeria booriae]MBC1307898.1 DUF4054 domain-containing protein [Listeria booriae]MBC1888028.1 DUF4054 domain-containing protein [Listeria booriae]MBC2148094.1 DUF4054 domain-containing protein [Listeria booriae]MBC2391363.1 DUF4054 domain-containing protein [Listeria booriae]
MAKTTVLKFKSTFPELASTADEVVGVNIDDAYLDVKESGFPEEQEDRANRYLAAHLLTMNNKHIKSEAVGSLKREYGGRNVSLQALKSTSYGQEYLRLVQEYASHGSGPSMIVVP